MLPVPLSPVCKLQQSRAQRPSILRKRVLRPEDGFLVNRAFDETVAFELAELRGENLLGRLGDTALQLTIAKTVARLEFAQDKRLPFSCNDT